MSHVCRFLPYRGILNDAAMDVGDIMLSEIDQTEKRQRPHDFTNTWNLKNKENKHTKQKFIDTEDKVLAARCGGGAGWVKKGKGSRGTNSQLQKQSQGCRVEHREGSQ